MYRPLLVLAAGTFAIGTDSFVIAGILLPMAATLDVDTATAGQLIGAYALTYALASPVMAALTARWPRRRVLLVGLAVFVVGNLATAALPEFFLVLGSRVLAGLGGAMFTPTAVAVAAVVVAPERRGRAIAVVMAGLSAATALGAPIGVAIGGLGDWRITILFVAALGVLAAIGVSAVLPRVPTPPAVGLRQRLAPIRDRRVGLTLATTLFVFTGLYVVYSYIGASFDRATGGDATILAGLLLVWGVAATAGNLAAGALTDRLGSRRLINAAVVLAAVDFALLPWTSAYMPTAVVALVVWGVSGWGLLVPQSHRLIAISPTLAPLLSALNSAVLYVGVFAAAAVGAIGIATVGPYALGLIGAACIAAGLGAAELAHQTIGQKASEDADQPVIGTDLPGTEISG